MSKTVNIAIVGATGVVGEAILEILQQRDFPCGEITLLASERSQGVRKPFKNKSLMVKSLSSFDFKNIDIAFFTAGAAVSEETVPKATAAGAIVIDNTSQFRYDPDVPLVVPEVNPLHLKNYKKKNIIANPNCSTIQMLVALKPIYDHVGIKSITVSTYQSVSGSGRKAIEALAKQTAQLLNGQPIEPAVYPTQIAFNVLPHIDHFQENGFTREEMKMIWETEKIFDDSEIAVHPTAVRVPVFFGHSEAIHIETKQPLSAEEALILLDKSPGVAVKDERCDKGYPTPVVDAQNQDSVYVGRVRNDINNLCGLNLWVVADNIRKGAALNSVQIAETLLSDYL